MSTGLTTLERVMAEDTITIAQAAQEMPGRPSTPTVWRWCKKGLRGVKLESYRAGNQLMTSRQAINRWLKAVNSGS